MTSGSLESGEWRENPSSGRAKTRRASLRAGAKAGIPFAVAAGLVAVSYGVVAEPILGTTVTLAMSVFVFAGSAQFGSVAVLGAGGGVPAALAASVLLNARYIPMGIAIAPSVTGRWWKRAAYGETMIDGSWAMADRGGGRFDPDFMVGATIPSYPMWVGGTAFGVFAGDLIPDPDRHRARRPLPGVLPRPAARRRAERGRPHRHRRRRCSEAASRCS